MTVLVSLYYSKTILGRDLLHKVFLRSLLSFYQVGHPTPPTSIFFFSTRGSEFISNPYLHLYCPQSISSLSLTRICNGVRMTKSDFARLKRKGGYWMSLEDDFEDGERSEGSLQQPRLLMLSTPVCPLLPHVITLCTLICPFIR